MSATCAQQLKIVFVLVLFVTVHLKYLFVVMCFLLRDKGSIVRDKRGCMYSYDFDSSSFSSNWFVTYSKLGDGCKLEFPVNLRSHIKFAPVTYFKESCSDELVARPSDFSELFSVHVLLKYIVKKFIVITTKTTRKDCFDPFLERRVSSVGKRRNLP